MKIKRRRKKNNKGKVNKGKRTGRPTTNDLSGLERRERRVRALEMHVEGVTMRVIGKELGITATTVCNDIKKELKRTNKDLTEKSDSLRTIELKRLNRLLQKLESGYRLKKFERTYGKGKKKTTVTEMKREISLSEYVMNYLKIMDRRSRYIAGLDVPKEVKADVGDNLKEAMETASTDTLTLLKQLAGE